MYLDLLTNAHLVDTSVWANPDVLASAVEYQARRGSRGGGGVFRFLGGLCCVVVIGIIALIVWLIVRKKQPPTPPSGQYTPPQ
ncbi:hypothetical protein [Nocardia arthritidis]|uniref:Uncharacterized protein n=1 Tax=Nocardia arthritidis TaxID=228602 RepID=A0A6G9Y4L7_9NOCA|nr:hypothetical protein [Nocardia arthritidis]QIS08013.1 hypothetical protein F5544_00400 [Nocardia arthritidis]